MTKHVEIKIENNTLKLSGDLDFNNAMVIFNEGARFIANSTQDVIVDFSGLVSSNSVVVALIINWMRAASEAGVTLQLLQVSPEISSLVKAAGLDKIMAG